MIRFNQQTPLISQLSRYGVEFDQKLMRALEVSSSCPDIMPEDQGFPDSYLTLAVYRLNTTLTRLIELDESRLNLFHEYRSAPKCAPAEIKPSVRLCSILDVAASLAAPEKTIGVGDFLRAIIAVTRTSREEPAIGFADQVHHSTFSIETLMWGLGYHAWTPLEKAPKVQELFAAIEQQQPAEDVSYLMAMEGNRIVFRATSILASYRVEGTAGEARPNLAVLSHFKEQYGSVTPSELMELEDLINDSRAKEQELQRFFENHPQFFRLWDKRDVFPQVYLGREDDGPLVPDFLLIDRAAQRATILDLKLPKEKLIRRQKNRDRFSAAVLEAQAQLLQYRSWFDERSNREHLKARLGIEIYRPQLGVIIGSSSDFRDAFDRQKLSDTMHGIDIVTYDDIVASAQKRLAIIRSAGT